MIPTFKYSHVFSYITFNHNHSPLILLRKTAILEVSLAFFIIFFIKNLNLSFSDIHYQYKASSYNYFYYFESI